MFGGGACGALLVLHAGTTAALGLAAGLLAVVTAGATLAARRPGSWRAADSQLVRRTWSRSVTSYRWK